VVTPPQQRPPRALITRPGNPDLVLKAKPPPGRLPSIVARWGGCMPVVSNVDQSHQTDGQQRIFLADVPYPLSRVPETTRRGSTRRALFTICGLAVNWGAIGLPFSVSAVACLPNSAGKPMSAVPPDSASCALISESSRAALISLLSFLMISAGVFLARLCPPRHCSQTRPNNPPKVGTPGGASTGLALPRQSWPDSAGGGFRGENRLSRRSKVI